MRPTTFITALLVTLACWASAGAQDQIAVEPVPARPSWRSAPVIDGLVVLPLVPVVGATDPMLASTRVWIPSPLTNARADSGDALSVRIRRLVASQPSQEIGWLTTDVRWDEASSDTPDRNASIWIAELEVPEGTRSITLGGRTVALFDPPSPHTARARAPETDIFQSAIEPLRADPTQRWRAQWLSISAQGTIEDPLAAAWGDAVTARWNRAIARLMQADPIVARLLERRLVALGAPASALLPVWIVDADAEGVLLRELLLDDADDDDLTGAASAFLARTPPAIAWVIDDAPLPEEGKLPSSDVGLLSLDAKPITLTLTSERGPARLSPVLEPGAVSEIVRLPINDEIPSDTVILRSSAGWTSRFGVLTAPLQGAPPGLSTGDFYFDHTRFTFGTDALPPQRTGELARALLTRLEPGVWQLIVECQLSEGAAPGRVEAWLGHRKGGRPPIIIAPGAEREDADVRTWTHVEDDRWIAGLIFNERFAADSDELLRLAVVRFDENNTRCAWPRPMVPGQTIPGRLAIDPRPWASPVE